MSKPAGKRCAKCGGPIRTACLTSTKPERCVHCADYDPNDPDDELRKK